MAEPPLIVRAATAADIGAAAAVAAASYHAGFAGILEEDVLAARTPALFAERFRTALDRLHVAERNGVIVGFSLMTAGHIDMLFVDPTAQGTGAGTALLADTQARGARGLECFRDNLSARRFYERHGWQLTRSYAREFAGQERDFVFYENV